MDIVERLRSGGGIEGTTRWYINPDGPEATDEIERLREALKEIEERTIDKIVVKLARAALKGDE